MASPRDLLLLAGLSAAAVTHAFAVPALQQLQQQLPQLQQLQQQLPQLQQLQQQLPQLHQLQQQLPQLQQLQQQLLDLKLEEQLPHLKLEKLQLLEQLKLDQLQQLQQMPQLRTDQLQQLQQIQLGGLQQLQQLQQLKLDSLQQHLPQLQQLKLGNALPQVQQLQQQLKLDQLLPTRGDSSGGLATLLPLNLDALRPMAGVALPLRTFLSPRDEGERETVESAGEAPAAAAAAPAAAADTTAFDITQLIAAVKGLAPFLSQETAQQVAFSLLGNAGLDLSDTKQMLQQAAAAAAATAAAAGLPSVSFLPEDEAQRIAEALLSLSPFATEIGTPATETIPAPASAQEEELQSMPLLAATPEAQTDTAETSSQTLNPKP
ncbi:hypothetical protein ACSSS7_002080 [Eimeria intestinalis]